MTIETAIAGLSRPAFLEAISRFEVSPFQVSREEQAEELAGNTKSCCQKFVFSMSLRWSRLRPYSLTLESR